jgi:hypothetical protein
VAILIINVGVLMVFGVFIVWMIGHKVKAVLKASPATAWFIYWCEHKVARRNAALLADRVEQLEKEVLVESVALREVDHRHTLVSEASAILLERYGAQKTVQDTIEAYNNNRRVCDLNVSAGTLGFDHLRQLFAAEAVVVALLLSRTLRQFWTKVEVVSGQHEEAEGVAVEVAKESQWVVGIAVQGDGDALPTPDHSTPSVSAAPSFSLAPSLSFLTQSLAKSLMSFKRSFARRSKADLKGELSGDLGGWNKPRDLGETLRPASQSEVKLAPQRSTANLSKSLSEVSFAVHGSASFESDGEEEVEERPGNVDRMSSNRSLASHAAQSVLRLQSRIQDVRPQSQVHLSPHSPRNFGSSRGKNSAGRHGLNVFAKLDDGDVNVLDKVEVDDSMSSFRSAVPMSAATPRGSPSCVTFEESDDRSPLAIDITALKKECAQLPPVPPTPTSSPGTPFSRLDLQSSQRSGGTGSWPPSPFAGHHHPPSHKTS